MHHCYVSPTACTVACSYRNCGYIHTTTNCNTHFLQFFFCLQLALVGPVSLHNSVSTSYFVLSTLTALCYTFPLKGFKISFISSVCDEQTCCRGNNWTKTSDERWGQPTGQAQTVSTQNQSKKVNDTQSNFLLFAWCDSADRPWGFSCTSVDTLAILCSGISAIYLEALSPFPLVVWLCSHIALPLLALLSWSFED